MRRYSNFVLKCRILGNRLLFLHSKVDLKPLTALLQIRLNRQARHVLEVQPSCTSTSEQIRTYRSKNPRKVFHAGQQRPQSFPSINVPHNPHRCHGHASTCRFSQKVAAGISISHSLPFLSRLLHASIIWPRCCYLLLLLPYQVFVPAFCLFYNNPGEQKLITCRHHQEIVGTKRKEKTRRAFGNDLTTMFWDEGNHSTDSLAVFFSFLWLDQLGLDGFGAG